jgi:hypothetical protein
VSLSLFAHPSDRVGRTLSMAEWDSLDGFSVAAPILAFFPNLVSMFVEGVGVRVGVGVGVEVKVEVD